MTTTTTLTERVSLDRRVPPLGGFNWTYLRIELMRKIRNRRTLIFTVVFPVLMYVVIGLRWRDTPLTQTPISQGGPSVAAWVMVSMGIYGAMMSATQTGAAVSLERSLGWSRQLRLTPLNPMVNIIMKVIAGMVLGLIAVLATFIVGAATGVVLSPTQWIATGLVGWLMAGAVFTTLGLAIGYLVPNENAAQITSLALVLFSFVGGLFIPLSQMPDFMQTVAKFTPVYGMGEIARVPLTGGDLDPLWFINAAVWLVIFVAGATWAFRRDTKRV